MDEVSEQDIQDAERLSPPAHDHQAIAAEDGSLRLHLQRVHHLDVPHGTSPATQVGLHDRLHEETAAADD